MYDEGFSEKMLNKEAIVRRCPVKKLFLEILQKLQKKTCARDYFLIKFQASKKESLSQVFSCEICEISMTTIFYRTPSVATSVNTSAKSYILDI